MSERSFYGFSTNVPPKKIRFYQNPSTGRWSVIAVLYDEDQAGILTPARANERVIVEGVARFERAVEAHDIAMHIISLMASGSKEKVNWKSFEKAMLLDENQLGFCGESREKRQNDLLSSGTRDDFLVKVGGAYVARKEVAVILPQPCNDSTVVINVILKNGASFSVAGFNINDGVGLERAMLQFAEIVNAQTLPETVKFRPCHPLDPDLAVAERKKCDLFFHGKLLEEKQLRQLKDELVTEQEECEEPLLNQKIAAKMQIKKEDDEDDPDVDVDDKLPATLKIYNDAPPPIAPAVNDGYQFVKMKKRS